MHGPRKKLSLCHNMISARLHILSLKYQRFTTSVFKDIGIWTFVFLAKTSYSVKNLKP